MRLGLRAVLGGRTRLDFDHAAARRPAAVLICGHGTGGQLILHGILDRVGVRGIGEKGVRVGARVVPSQESAQGMRADGVPFRTGWP